MACFNTQDTVHTWKGCGIKVKKPWVFLGISAFALQQSVKSHTLQHAKHPRI